MYNFAADGEDVDRGGDSVHALLLPHQRALGKELWWGDPGFGGPGRGLSTGRGEGRQLCEYCTVQILS